MQETVRAESFGTSVAQGVMPLLIWAAHFFLSYASSEVACALDYQRHLAAGIPLPKVLLAILTVAAVASLVALTVVALRSSAAHARAGSSLGAIRLGAALLAMVGVLWSAVPIAFAPLCGQ